MLKIILFFVIAAVIEIIQMTVLSKPHINGKADPDAVVVTAYRGASFPDVYDEKSGRNVSSYKYVWEYQGKEHSITLCDSNFNQWEPYIGDFAGRPDFVPEIKITVNRNTGKYYIPKYVRERKRNDLLSLVISAVVSWLIVNMIFLETGSY